MKIDSQAIRGFFQKNERCVEGVYYATSRLLKYVAFSILRNEGRAQEIVRGIEVTEFWLTGEGRAEVDSLEKAKICSLRNPAPIPEK